MTTWLAPMAARANEGERVRSPIPASPLATSAPKKMLSSLGTMCTWTRWSPS